MPQLPYLVMPPAKASPEVAREDKPVNALFSVVLHVVESIN